MVRRVLMTKGSFCGENVDVWCFWVMAGITPVISGRGLSFSKRNYNLFNGGNDFQGIAISWLVTTEKTLVTWLIPSTERIHISPKRVVFFQVIDSKVLAGRGHMWSFPGVFFKKSGREYLGGTYFLVQNAFKVDALVKLVSSWNPYFPGLLKTHMTLENPLF